MRRSQVVLLINKYFVKSMNIILALGNRNNLKAKNICVKLRFIFITFDLPLVQN